MNLFANHCVHIFESLSVWIVENFALSTFVIVDVQSVLHKAIANENRSKTNQNDIPIIFDTFIHTSENGSGRGSLFLETGPYDLLFKLSHNSLN